MTKPSRFFENGFDACSGDPLFVDRAERSEKRIRASICTELSVPMQSAVSVSPRRIASTPSWIAVAPEAHAVETEMGSPRVPSRSATWFATLEN